MATAAPLVRMLRMTTARVTEMPLRLEAVTEDPFGDFEPAADSSEARRYPSGLTATAISSIFASTSNRRVTPKRPTAG